ncbi:MAG TPA: SRPBCC family protein [Actinomycetota bacterium]|nr:SRPBCC family protein [Actinomycetota bacterium]
MRYADGPTAQVEIHIDAPPSRVWELVTDINLPARFSSEFQGAEWIEPATRAALGATFKGRNKHPAVGEWETTSYVVGCDPERLFAWQIGEGEEPGAQWRFELVPDGDGTLLKQWMRMGPGRSGLNAAIDAMPDKEERIIERRCEEHRRNMTATVEGIKALAERA